MRMQDNSWFHPARLRMKRLWLLFAQTVTVLVAVFFVVATLQPQWLGRRALPSVVPVLSSRLKEGPVSCQMPFFNSCISSPRIGDE